jgi:hypothetical protein
MKYYTITKNSSEVLSTMGNFSPNDKLMMVDTDIGSSKTSSQ